MKPAIGLLSHLTDEEHQALALPSTFMAIAVLVVVLMQGFIPDLDPSQRWLYLITGTIGLVYVLIQFLVVLPISKRVYWVHWIVAFINGIGTAFLSLLTPFSPSSISGLLVISGVIISSTIVGRWPTYLFIAVHIISSYLLENSIISRAGFQWVDYTLLLAVSALIAETILRLGRLINKQMGRLETVNKLAHRMASSIEPNQVVPLINAALQDSLPADTYFFGLVRDDKINLELFYDDGEYFPPIELSMDGSLAGWVIKNRKPLLLSDLPVDMKKLNLPVQIVGQPKTSLSWIGTPLEAGGHVLGVMAMAAYRRNAFTKSDLELLESMAQQAALVIDNAYHHAEVEHQSHLDSMTQVYNHGYFLMNLDRLIRYAETDSKPLSLLMLDIDHFKHYNDTFGHQVGDRLLYLLARTLRESIRDADILGRWGGEEFSVLLPETTGLQAAQIAERIRQNVEKIPISDMDGMPISPPQVSQGIAVFPYEAGDADALVHLADQRMYLAKERGRNQIEPDPASWGD
jgi:diguanylate cyclase (GGDEF)-like protein